MCQMYVKYYLVIFPNISNVSNVCQILLSNFSPNIYNVSNVCQILLSNFPPTFIKCQMYVKYDYLVIFPQHL